MRTSFLGVIVGCDSWLRALLRAFFHLLHIHLIMILPLLHTLTLPAVQPLDHGVNHTLNNV